MTKTIIPSPLNPGDTIGIMAPSGAIDGVDIETGKKALEALGYNVIIHPQTNACYGQMAGTAEQKAEALHDLFADQTVNAIITARGGNRAMDMLPLLDYKLIYKNPKALIGFSDVTALLHAIHVKTGMITYHGPVLRNIHTRPDLQQMINMLAGKTESIDLSCVINQRSGDAKGTLVGGNLSLLQALIGTPYEPIWKKSILFIEDIGDHLNRYDRMLMQFKLRGIFDEIAGLIVGEFSATQDNPDRPFFAMEDIIAEHTAGYDFPVLINAPFGHGDRLVTLPIGRNVELQATSLRLL